AVGAAAVACVALLSLVRGDAPLLRRPVISAGTALPSVLLALLTTAWIGATTPGVTWFGSLVHHGPRGGDEVAITFDDGPDPPYTLELMEILDRYSTRATFFTVGKALEARPDVSRALLN